MAKALNCKFIFLEHVSIVVSAQENGDERMGQVQFFVLGEKRTLNHLRLLAQDLMILTLIVVAVTNRFDHLLLLVMYSSSPSPSFSISASTSANAMVGDTAAVCYAIDRVTHKRYIVDAIKIA